MTAKKTPAAPAKKAAKPAGKKTSTQQRGSSTAERRAHNPKAAGSTPAPATNVHRLRKPQPDGARRPMPPAGMDGVAQTMRPAPEVRAWILEQILEEGGALHNPEHQHLLSVDFEILWASTGYQSKGRRIIGQAELVAFRCSAWQKWRQEQQMHQWFGRVPDFLITFDADYAANCTDIEWCALVEHELYHIAHVKGLFGEPEFTRDGLPKVTIHAHDVEEFIGVVRRYGVGNPTGNIARFVAAAAQAPEVGHVAIAGACGTCLRQVA